ncbi:MAG: hypothetical protein A2312_02020 [Candidatus Staskawiczbacteria bacterium RIFOXYB2_FULL_32_9]|uniref:Thioredoxin-like fold domain-containing protein n=1 Tax=Candidatus Staskawiczbacteria bacterium RIFOXYD1_FULL_32_13 TaxID=1802234 RepID=A0A1G2JRX0_9BACT|nr:MAG: hypothetical protein UR22_C0022G0007 [Parcubacteria group bacterium GW2011_GWC2_32_10]OGZ78882.1 MAG: hypothetical protein A2256_00825 [Candidatus Staskawiczbacteria bacterium RIFOXYA2_FULL_32_7]OGZ79807.1 MAG: hypothetical protein A2360_00850 [Candidatus Staskawiczbacteria bacterium RIFOXYB1_FULL_32_11]OGZ81058.1 MAG: hypothetical protein A2312_02020 [Candidatus Staskawiczbacteria bacterium RIFOXYB2_FULL_32_9]OGZ86240.1 MAG: hypothetical protein A2463_05050 [Candidatus Staskawiczbacter
MKLGKIKIDQNFILIAVAVVVIAIGGFLVFGGDSFAEIFDFKMGKTLSKEEIAKKSIEYLNNVVLKGQSTATFSDVSEESGLVKIKLKVGANEFDSYATKDGKLLFPQAFNLVEAETANQPADNTEATPKKTAADIQKVDKPVLDAFVVSKCPFGLQMQRVLADVVKNAPALTPNIVVRYMGSVANGKITAMHGDAEAQENLRQICIRDEQNSKYWNYISCHIKKGDVDGCLTSAGVNTSTLNSCMTDASKGLAYAQKDFDMQNKYNVTGSPTLILQDGQASEFDFGGRNSEALKNMICAGFNNQPSICATKLNTASAASSFSETYASTAAAASANTQAGCEPAN